MEQITKDRINCALRLFGPLTPLEMSLLLTNLNLDYIINVMFLMADNKEISGDDNYSFPENRYYKIN
jgi:hypothetical protein